MADLYSLDRLVDRDVFPESPLSNDPPGIQLRNHILPSNPFGPLRYAHVARATDGDVVPSSTNAINPMTGAVEAEGVIVVVDTEVVPPQVVRTVGEFALVDGTLQYLPEPTL